MNTDHMQQTIERLTKQKIDLTRQHTQQILIKDMRIKELSEFQRQLRNENNRLIGKLEENQGCIISATQTINGLLTMLELDQSLDDQEILEDFKKLESSNKSRTISILDKSNGSQYEFPSEYFEVAPLETAISNLEKAWEVLIRRTKGNEELQSEKRLNKYLHEQMIAMQTEQRALRDQKKALETIHNESQRSRHEIAEKLDRDIQLALKLSHLNLEKMSMPELKQKLGVYCNAISELTGKIKKLEQQLYSTKSQYTEKLELIKQQSARIKEKAETELSKKDKEIGVFKSSVSKR